jgi:hypothetical protein
VTGSAPEPDTAIIAVITVDIISQGSYLIHLHESQEAHIQKMAEAIYSNTIAQNAFKVNLCKAFSDLSKYRKWLYRAVFFIYNPPKLW